MCVDNESTYTVVYNVCTYVYCIGESSIRHLFFLTYSQPAPSICITLFIQYLQSHLPSTDRPNGEAPWAEIRTPDVRI